MFFMQLNLGGWMIMHDCLPIHTKPDSREILRGYQQVITGTARVCAIMGGLINDH
jgi:hypothetical protein